MKLVINVDKQVLAGARARAASLGKSLDELIVQYLTNLANLNAERDIEEFEKLSGRGNSRGWKFNRDEIYERRRSADALGRYVRNC